MAQLIAASHCVVQLDHWSRELADTVDLGRLRGYFGIFGIAATHCVVQLRGLSNQRTRTDDILCDGMTQVGRHSALRRPTGSLI